MSTSIVPATAMSASSLKASLPFRLMRSGIGLGLVASAAFTGWMLVGIGGWKYYATPLAVRGYEALHRDLRPSGPIGQTLGVVGAALMLVPFLYMLRKRYLKTARVGTLKTWLEVHLFCGVLAPVLITFHSAFKFNGIISAAYWAMVVVVLSGFVGRYLFVRIPRTLRGTELTRQELDARADELMSELTAVAGEGPWLERAHAIERAAAPDEGHASFVALLFGEPALRWKLRTFRRAVHASSLPVTAQAPFIALVTERALLLRRIAFLQKTKAAFSLWHVFHLPLVYLLLVIVAGHVGLALYLGYVPFRW